MEKDWSLKKLANSVKFSPCVSLQGIGALGAFCVEEKVLSQVHGYSTAVTKKSRIHLTFLSLTPKSAKHQKSRKNPNIVCKILKNK